jgi:hypothetical protein
MIDLVISNKEYFVIITGLVISFLGIVVPLIQFLIGKNKEQEIINYKKFHELISGLSNQGGNLGVDQQIAIIYELTNFPEHYPVIKRILSDLKTQWELRNDNASERLIKEINETVNFMGKNAPRRFLIKWVKRLIGA